MVMVIDPTSFQMTGDRLYICQTNEMASFHISNTGEINQSFLHLKITGNMVTLGITVFDSITNKANSVFSFKVLFLFTLYYEIIFVIY